MVTIIYLIEEHLLMSIIQYQDYPNIIKIIEDRFNIANKIGSHDESFPIKTACMNLLSSMLLIVLNNKKFEDIVIF